VGSLAPESGKAEAAKVSRQNRTPIFADLVSNCKPILEFDRLSAAPMAPWMPALAIRADPKTQLPLRSARALQILDAKKAKIAFWVAAVFD